LKQNNKINLQTMTIAALLIAIAIVIPVFCPKIVLGPASVTLASHVPVFIAMFISPPVAVAVALGSTAGFLLAGFPIVIVLRAFTHILFALTGAYILKKHSNILSSFGRGTALGLLLALIHAISEVAAVTLYYLAMGVPKGGQEYLTSVVLLVGGVTVVHSMVDFGIAVFVWRPLTRIIKIPFSAKIAPKRKTAVQE